MRTNQSVIGKTYKFFRIGGTGAIATSQENLIKYDGPAWDQYVLTLGPPQRGDGRVLFDVNNSKAGNPSIIGQMPFGAPLVELEWGSGGARNRVTFDWPMRGGAFHVAGQGIKCDVRLRVPAELLITPDAELPVFMAMLAPGRVTTPSPMTLRTRIVMAAGGGRQLFDIPPYARELWCSMQLAGQPLLDFADGLGANIYTITPPQPLTLQLIPVKVPSTAAFLGAQPDAIQPTDVSQLWYLEV